MIQKNMPDAPHGKHLWVWELGQSGGVEATIKLAKALGMHGLIVKSHDGANIWKQFADSAPKIKKSGLVLGAWGYFYAQDLKGEAEAVSASFAHGADWYVADVEAPFSNQPKLARELGQLVRARLPHAVIGYTTYAESSLHQDFPYAEFAAWTDCILPQIYWADAGMAPQAMLDQSLAGLKKFKRPIYPIGQAYGSSSPSEIAVFGERAAKQDLQGISFWDVQSSSAAQREAMKGVAVYNPKPKKKPFFKRLLHLG